MHSCLQTSSSLLPNMASLTTFLLLSSLIFISSAQSDDYRYRNCSSTFKCGYLQESLSYPFWSDSRPQYCGHPSFKLSCNDNVTIEVGSQTLTVVNVSMATKSMVLSWSGYSFDPCPQNPQNITIDQAIFNYTSNVDLVKFFYGCPSSPPYEQGEANYSCPTSSHYSGKMAYYIVNPVLDSTHESCEVNVVVPMLETPRVGSDSSSVLRCLKEGFEVDWVGLEGVGSCDDCVGSGGVCGYDWSSKNQDCFCEDGVRFGGGCNGSSSSLGNVPTSTSDGYTNPSPDHSSGKNTAKTVAIGVGAGLLGAAVFIGVGFIFYRRRYKKPYQTPANQVPHRRNVPLDPTALSSVENGDSFLGVSLFNYDELEEATEYFSPSKELGEGGFGTVYHGKLGDGREVAIKRMFENNSKRVQQFMNEIEILTHLRHKNLVTLYGCTSRHSRELLLVYEYVSNGTVADHLHCRKARLAPNAEYSPLSWHTRLSIAIETASALVYLHASDIIHRDVKTNNILLDDHCTVKVADFGLSRLFPLDLTHVSTAPQGTPGYVDPEYHQCYQLTDKSDVYSFGVVLIELISTQPAVDITRHRHEINLSNLAINKIQNDSLHELVDPSLGFDVDEKVKEEVIGVAELAFQCLQHDREMRPTMDEVLEVLTRIRECKKQDDMIKKSEYMGVMKAEVVDISAEEALRLKTDLSPASSNGSKRKIDTDNTSASRSC